MRYMNHNLNLDALLKQAMEADVTALRQFLTTNPGQPMWVPFMAELKRSGPLTLQKDCTL